MSLPAGGDGSGSDFFPVPLSLVSTADDSRSLKGVAPASPMSISLSMHAQLNNWPSRRTTPAVTPRSTLGVVWDTAVTVPPASPIHSKPQQPQPPSRPCLSKSVVAPFDERKTFNRGRPHSDHHHHTAPGGGSPTRPSPRPAAGLRWCRQSPGKLLLSSLSPPPPVGPKPLFPSPVGRPRTWSAQRATVTVVTPPSSVDSTPSTDAVPANAKDDGDVRLAVPTSTAAVSEGSVSLPAAAPPAARYAALAAGAPRPGPATLPATFRKSVLPSPANAGRGGVNLATANESFASSLRSLPSSTVAAASPPPGRPVRSSVPSPPTRPASRSGRRRRRVSPSHHHSHRHRRPVHHSRLSSSPSRSSSPTRRSEFPSVRDIMASTGFSRRQVIAITNRFKALRSMSSTADGIDKEMFRRGIPLMSMEDDFFVERVFSVLDVDGSGTIGYEEYLNALSALSHGDELMRAKFLFQVYATGNEVITRQGLRQFFMSSLRADDSHGWELSIIDELFDRIDRNGTNRVTLDDLLFFVSNKMRQGSGEEEQTVEDVLGRSMTSARA